MSGRPTGPPACSPPTTSAPAQLPRVRLTGASACDRLREEVAQPLRLAREAEGSLDQLARAPRELGGEAVVLEDARHRRCQGRRVAGGDEEAGDTVFDELGNAGQARGGHQRPRVT